MVKVWEWDQCYCSLLLQFDHEWYHPVHSVVNCVLKLRAWNQKGTKYVEAGGTGGYAPAKFFLSPPKLCDLGSSLSDRSLSDSKERLMNSILASLTTALALGTWNQKGTKYVEAGGYWGICSHKIFPVCQKVV